MHLNYSVLKKTDHLYNVKCNFKDHFYGNIKFGSHAYSPILFIFDFLICFG